jgi:hypothetical protein
MHHAEHYRRIFDFIADLGLSIREASLPSDTFLPGLALRAGGLIVDPQALQWPGDLLHEAGHLAVLPPALRAQADDDLGKLDTVEHAGEAEALAWAYAASVALALPTPVLVHEGGYLGNARGLLQMYAFGVYPGLRGLCAAGMAVSTGFPTPGVAAGAALPHYPRMLRWLRDSPAAG